MVNDFLYVDLADAVLVPGLVGTPAYFPDETFALRGITLGASCTATAARIRFVRNGDILSPYSDHVKGDNANIWFHWFKPNPVDW